MPPGPDVARQLGQQGLSYVDREYRWPQVIHKIEQLLASIERRDGLSRQRAMG